MQPKFVTSAGKSREELVHGEFLFVSPLRNRVQQSPPSSSQIGACLDASWCSEKLSQIGIVKIWIRLFVHLAFARVIRFELHVKAIVLSDTIFRRAQRWFAGKRTH